MKQGLSTATLELLGYRDPKVVNSDITADIYSAKFLAGIEIGEYQFVYIKTRATKLDLLNIPVRKGIKTYFVKTDSSAISQQNIDHAFPGENHKLYELDQLVWSKILAAFDPYIEGLRAGLIVDKYYIQPRSDSATSMPDREMIDFLASRSQSYTPGSVVILRAPAAVGKTTLCRMVAYRLLESLEQYRAIPVFIESSHWSQLRLESTHDLWEVVRNSLLRYAPDLQITKSLFETALRTGYVVFIFDGLDELCGRSEAAFNAHDLVDELATIAENSTARILVSTRTAYWDSEVKGGWKNVQKLDIAPFNKQQALQYFDRRFATNKSKREKAQQLYQSIIQANQLPPTPGGSRLQFVNLPACVSLLADIVDRDEFDSFNIGSPQLLAQTMLGFLCRRDRQRKALTTPPEAQLFAFAQVAATNFSPFPQYSIELLSAAGFDPADEPRLIDHPLTRVRPDRIFDFAYEFLDPFFKAYFLSEYLHTPGKVVESDALALMRAYSNGKYSILEHLAGLCLDLDSEKIAVAAAGLMKTESEAGSFLLHLSMAMADQEKKSHSERAALLALASGNRELKKISSLRFFGSYQRIDISNFTIDHCHFIDCSLTDFSMNESTSIKNCSFEGDISLGDAGSINRWKSVFANSNTADSRAAIVVSFLIDATEAKRRDVLLDAFGVALQKFWHGGVPRSTIDRNNWKRGLLAQSPLSDLLLEGFLKSGLLEEIVISGTEAGGLLLDRSSYQDVQKFMDSRALSGRVSIAFDYCSPKV